MSLEEENNRFFTDQEGNLHEGILFILTDAEGRDYVRYREQGTGKLYPTEEKREDKGETDKE